MKIGILAIQGSVIEHARALRRAGAEVLEVRTCRDLAKVSGLVMPGGESTTIGKLLRIEGLDKAIISRVREGMPAYGTCAGAILLAKKITGIQKAPNLGLMDIEVERNAYGRQIDSFETEVDVPVLGQKPVPAVFIRAPKIVSTGAEVKILAKYDGKIVMCQEKNMLVSTFHPEMTDDLRVHKYFIRLCK
jgi:5'-phosphate synthase pdxT subunit